MLAVSMMGYRPGTLILLGVILLVLGWAIPFLMVLRVLQPSFFLSFFSWGASVGGLFLGSVGVVMYMRKFRKKP
jgi:hypothetical protein